VINDLKILDAIVPRRTLPAFVAKCFDTLCPGETYLENWHIDWLACHVAPGGGTPRALRLVVNLPPRSLKSIAILSGRCPTWLLGKDPTRRIIAVSYSEDLARKHARGTAGSFSKHRGTGVPFPGTPTRSAKGIPPVAAAWTRWGDHRIVGVSVDTMMMSTKAADGHDR